uniref:Bromo domain-containing protein n=2 Tax=Mesocestoides corti TaxID=53468 RepID=A0A5K3F5T6_MESCO
MRIRRRLSINTAEISTSSKATLSDESFNPIKRGRKSKGLRDLNTSDFEASSIPSKRRYTLRKKIPIDLDVPSPSKRHLERQVSDDTDPSKVDSTSGLEDSSSSKPKQYRDLDGRFKGRRTIGKRTVFLVSRLRSLENERFQNESQDADPKEDKNVQNLDHTAISAIESPRRLRPRDSSVAPISYSFRVLEKRSEVFSHHFEDRTHSKPTRNEEVGEDDGDEDDATEEGEETPGGRRYPMRNRRHPDVYQVAPKKVNGTSHRDWLAGTPYRENRKRGRHRDHLRHHNDNFSSSTGSLSIDVDDDETGGEGEQKGGSFVHQGYHSRRRRLHRRPSSHQDDLHQSSAFMKSFLRQAAEGLMPINFKPQDVESGPLRSRLVAGAGLTDIEPMNFDTGVTFADVGGHQAQIRALQESVLLPLVYPEVFNSFGIEPPRGVLFYGPPGTGKTLLARALANECSRMTATAARPLGASAPDQAGSLPANTASRPIAFFMRKGADCLSKWVGESERQLRMLFDQAYRMRPSIIFFDELDGLAPVRSSRQDQIHSSIVSTLLSLMDGLDRRAEVVVIGATNRPDAIDPALRRPGRFDREFAFSLPNEAVRRRILEIHTSKWKPAPSPSLLDELAEKTSGFCGADLKGLATEACLCCLRRQYPQVYESKMKLAVNLKYLVVDRLDWLEALRLIRPANLRTELDVGSAGSASAAALASTLRRPLVEGTPNQSEGPTFHLLEPIVDQLTARIARALSGAEACSCVRDAAADVMLTWDSHQTPVTVSPMLVRQVVVEDNFLPSCVFPAVWRRLESVEVYTINLSSLFTASASGEACVVTSITQIVAAARRTLINQHRQPCATASPSIPLSSLLGVVLFVPRIDRLLARLPTIACHHLLERLTEATTTSEPGCSRRIVLVATVKNLPPAITIATGEEPQHQQQSQTSRTSPLSIRVPPSISPRVTTPNVPDAAICNGHASAKTVAWLRDQQNGRRHRARPPAASILEESAADEEVENQLQTRGPCPPFNTLSAALTGVSPLSSPGGGGGGCGGNADVMVNHNLRRLFRFPHMERISLRGPGEDLRRNYLRPVFFDWFDPTIAASISATVAEHSSSTRDRLLQRPPTPQPVDESTADILARRQRTMTSREVANARETRDRLLRQLRVQLRCVVAHLARDRRFAVFTRPVQPDEAPDYLEVIKHPMDLGTVRDKIDAHRYTSVREFAKDLELIYKNALNYNPPNVPRSREIRGRAFEFWDAAEILLEENLSPPDLEEQVAEAIAACPMSGPQTDQSNESNSRSPPPLPIGRRYSRRLHVSPINVVCP